jgi:hypothetical protein
LLGAGHPRQAPKHPKVPAAEATKPQGVHDGTGRGRDTSITLRRMPMPAGRNPSDTARNAEGIRAVPPEDIKPTGEASKQGDETNARHHVRSSGARESARVSAPLHRRTGVAAWTDTPAREGHGARTAEEAGSHGGDGGILTTGMPRTPVRDLIPTASPGEDRITRKDNRPTGIRPYAHAGQGRIHTDGANGAAQEGATRHASGILPPERPMGSKREGV